MSLVTFEELRARLRSRTPARIVDVQAAEAAVALILIPSSTDLEALFIRRAEVSGDPWSGHMALPGGRRESEDSTLRATAIRETAEETGIVLTPDSYLADLDDFTPRTRTLPRIVVRPHVFGLERRPPLSLSPEVAECLWISFSELRRSRSDVDLDVNGTSFRFPAFVVGENVIWGLTERIVNPFIELIDNKE